MSVVARNAKLQELLVSLNTFGLKERARLTKEAAWLEIVRASVGIGAVQSSNLELTKAVVQNEVNDYLGQ